MHEHVASWDLCVSVFTYVVCINTGPENNHWAKAIESKGSICILCSIKTRYDQLYNFSNSEEIIRKYQSGFRSLRSTVTAPLEATDSWEFHIDCGYANAVAFIKLTFDIVDHETLLRNMNPWGIYEKTFDWFKSYLTDYTQWCSVNGCLPDFTTLKCGVPHGTILGPLLFLIYINDLLKCLSFRVPRIYYADDTHITYAGSDLHLIQSSLSHNLEKLSK